MPRLDLLPLLLLLLAGCSAQTVNYSMHRKAAKPTGTFAAGALSLLEPPNLESYTLGPLDILQVEILDIRELGKFHVQTSEIDATGRITLPQIGRIQCQGITVVQLRKAIVERLKAFLVSPRVSVKVIEFRSKRIAVLGPVTAGGVINLQQNQTTVVGAVALAGGLTEQAGRTAILVRAQVGADLQPSLDIDLERLANGDLSQNYTVQPGDVIQVRPADRYYLTGFVAKPGEYVMRREISLLEAIAISGGLINPDASPDETYILRVGEPPIQCDLEAIALGEAEDPYLMAGDLIQVRQGFWRGAGLSFYRFIKGGIGFGYNTAQGLPNSYEETRD